MAAYSYEFAKGFVCNTGAETVGQVIEQITKRDGQVTPSALLDASRDDSAPLHGCFEWDDSIAAERYRLHQARQMIANVRIVQSTDTAERDRAFVSAPKKNVYVTLESALGDEEMRKHLLKQAKEDARVFLAKYRRLTELSEVNDALTKFISG